MLYESYTLPNGIRVVHIPDDSNVSLCGLFINTGTRDELENEHGMAHFMEHLVFKGTKKRKAYHINSALDDVGGNLNAYTTKEETCIYASFLSQYTEKAMDLISDIIFNSTYPEKEINKEKDVVIDEINSYKDSPAELIFDDFEELLFHNHPIGRNILGTPKTLKKFSKADIEAFYSRNYCTDQMVFASVGNIPFPKLKKLAQKYFEPAPLKKSGSNRIKFENYEVLTKIAHRKTYQTHCIMGNLAYDHTDKRRIVLALLNSILGGPSLNSRLNLNLREKHGYVYNIETSYTGFTDTGLFSIYFGCDKTNYEKCLELINKEISRIKNDKLGVLQLSKAKKQLFGQIAISAENKESLLLTLGKSYLHYNVLDSLQIVQEKIEQVTADSIIEVARDILDMDKFCILIYK